MNKDILLKATKKKKWANVDEVIRELNKTDYWDAKFTAEALLSKKRAHIRREMRHLKDENGAPLFAEIVVPDEEGGEQRVYKQETLFNLDDYRRTINYHATVGNQHIRLAQHYRKQAFKRFHVQIELPFDLADEREGK